MCIQRTKNSVASIDNAPAATRQQPGSVRLLALGSSSDTDSIRTQVQRRSKRMIPEGHVQRTWRVRIFPTAGQKKTLKEWMHSARKTYNWVLGVLRKQYAKHGKTIIPINFEALKKNFVTCKMSRFPCKLRHLKDTPCSVREATMQELAEAYKAQFKRYRETGEFTTPSFRSVKHPYWSITVPPQNWSKKVGKRWQCYITQLPDEGKLRVRTRDQKRVLNRYPNGPDREVKIVHTAAPATYEDLNPDARGHLAALDPGSNPFVNYYSPTRMQAGSFGTADDLNRLRRPSKWFAEWMKTVAVVASLAAQLETSSPGATPPFAARSKCERKNFVGPLWRSLERNTPPRLATDAGSFKTKSMASSFTAETAAIECIETSMALATMV
ncbi:uncharacterized protein EV422DRAFT_576950 [Fimicolochytrium jonesii]|uniref:uncharacterized protein n=1 Tax=Fimicolochytrium jonesii TaxID=1396493 RepID=UPI0022FDF992|nr:uncharacterized protein EV422DRAFT_576950 [Fimicolochytrium jonesii]KAI8823371.1 hypothetical protein EV422DRAFT_576950 [Fimicolochytrium jonesii]